MNANSSGGSLAKGLRDDYEAVKAGMTLPWSNGPVEGHINRLKMLKRQNVWTRRNRLAQSTVPTGYLITKTA